MCLPEEQQLLVQEAHLLLGALAVAQLKDKHETNNDDGGQKQQLRKSNLSRNSWDCNNNNKHDRFSH